MTHTLMKNMDPEKFCYTSKLCFFFFFFFLIDDFDCNITFYYWVTF